MYGSYDLITAEYTSIADVGLLASTSSAPICRVPRATFSATDVAQTRQPHRDDIQGEKMAYRKFCTSFLDKRMLRIANARMLV